MNTNPKENHEQIAVTATGVLTAAGYGVDENFNSIFEKNKTVSSRDELKLNTFKPAKHLSDKRMLKAVSYSDGLGLAAIEDLKRDERFPKGKYEPAQFGLFVGAQESAYHDNQNYVRSMLETANEDGSLSERKFGETCMVAKPTTLLIGLPNNVLCYGSMILESEGPNNNYTASDVGAHMALHHAARALKTGKAEACVAGGVSALTDRLHNRVFELKGQRNGENFTEAAPYEKNDHGYLNSDGAAFLMLEDASKCSDPVAFYINSKFSNSFNEDTYEDYKSTIEETLFALLNENDLSAEDLGAIFLSGTGIEGFDKAELEALAQIDKDKKAAKLTTAKVWGNMVDAGGIAEVSLMPTLAKTMEAPEALRVSGEPHSLGKGSYALVLRTSPSGQFSASLFKFK